MAKRIEFDIYFIGFASKYTYTSIKTNWKQSNILYATNNEPKESSCIFSWNSLKNWKLLENYQQKKQ